MSEPFLAEIRMVGFNFAPRGWAFCDGQILPINQNQSLYSLLGTTYGGDGRTSFALPDLRGRTPLHVGNSETSGSSSHAQGNKSGLETVSLSTAEFPGHTHQLEGVTDSSSTGTPNGAYWADNLGLPYGSPVTGNNFAADTIANAGGGQAHDTMQPYLTVAFCIALQGSFPSRN